MKAMDSNSNITNINSNFCLCFLCVFINQAILSLWGNSGGFDSFVSGLKEKLVVSDESKSSSPLVPVKDLDALKTLLLDSDLSSRLQLPGGCYHPGLAALEAHGE